MDERRPRQRFGLPFCGSDRRQVRCVSRAEALQPELVEQLPTAGTQHLSAFESVTIQLVTQECAQNRNRVLAPVEQLADYLSHLVAEVVERDPGGDARGVVPAVGEDDRPRLGRL